MVHEPCSSTNKCPPCMNEGKCSKYHPTEFQSFTLIDQDDYPIYGEIDNRQTIEKNEQPL